MAERKEELKREIDAIEERRKREQEKIDSMQYDQGKRKARLERLQADLDKLEKEEAQCKYGNSKTIDDVPCSVRCPVSNGKFYNCVHYKDAQIKKAFEILKIMLGDIKIDKFSKTTLEADISNLMEILKGDYNE